LRPVDCAGPKAFGLVKGFVFINITLTVEGKNRSKKSLSQMIRNKDGKFRAKACIVDVCGANITTNLRQFMHEKRTCICP
jgi:hypothetical protein